MRRRAFMGVAAKITMGAALAATDLAILATPAAAGPTPSHIGLGDVQRIEDMTAALDKQDLAFGGGSCREAIIGYLNWAVKLRDATMTDNVRQALDTALAHLEELAGWASYDLLLLDSAEHFYLRSLHSAQLADYPFMAAKALGRLGKIYLDEGQYGDALRMFQLAVLPASEAGSSRMTAYLHLHDALVYAQRGNVKAVEGSIRRAEDDYADIAPDEPARQKRFLDNGGLHLHIALAHSGLAEHSPAHSALAVDATRTGLGQRADWEGRSLLAYRIPLALNAYRSSATEYANKTTGQVLAGLPDVSSRRVNAGLRQLAIEAATHDSTAADLAHRIDGHIAT